MTWKWALNCALALLLGLAVISSAGAEDLQSIYDAAGPGEGYDKLIILDPGEVYTGYMIVQDGVRCAVHGNGALIELDAFGALMVFYNSTLDIDGCVITGGTEGIYFAYCNASTVRNCTIIGNETGVRCEVAPVTIENCIIANNTERGISCFEGHYPTIQYNDVWGNGQGNYMYLCSG
jgi:parallel beta-helix repeat protein